MLRRVKSHDPHNTVQLPLVLVKLALNTSDLVGNCVEEIQLFLVGFNYAE